VLILRFFVKDFFPLIAIKRKEQQILQFAELCDEQAKRVINEKRSLKVVACVEPDNSLSSATLTAIR
jgi:hypothetical protein